MLMALTIWEPWATAIARADPKQLGPDLGKTVENRSWLPPPAQVGRYIAVHAAKRPVDTIDAREVWDELGGFEDWAAWLGELAAHSSKVVAVARISGASKKRGDFTPAQLRWKVEGQFGWVLEDVRALPRPVLARGMQGLWMLSEELEGEVRAQVGLQQMQGATR